MKSIGMISSKMLGDFESFEVEINCEKHGTSTVTKTYYRGKLKNEPICQKCKIENEKKIIELESHRKRENFIAQQMEELNKHRRIQRYAIENYDESLYPEAKSIFEFTKKYCNSIDEMYQHCRDLIFHGGVGTSKTFFAVSILKEAIKKGYTAKYTTAMSLFYAIKETYSDRSKSEQEIIDKAVGYDFLVIDEIGASYDSGMEKVTVNHIFDQRHLNMKPTICVSNLGLDDMKKSIGARAIDRLTDGGLVWHLSWESLRGRKGV